MGDLLQDHESVSYFRVFFFSLLLNMDPNLAPLRVWFTAVATTCCDQVRLGQPR
jgi:hypothetical protein